MHWSFSKTNFILDISKYTQDREHKRVALTYLLSYFTSISIFFPSPSSFYPPRSCRIPAIPSYHIVSSILWLCRTMLEEVVRGGHSRQGNNINKGLSATTALCVVQKKCELCHCYFPNLSAWLGTAGRKFQGKGLNFPSMLGFLELHPWFPN
jgi:hypothetical protein